MLKGNKLVLSYNAKISICLILFVFSKVFGQLPSLETKLPIVVINTSGRTIVDEPKIDASMGIIYNGENVINKSTDQFNNFDGLIGIELRGASSQLLPKKSYAIEIRDLDGSDAKASLLYMPSESDWVLSGPYSDKTFLRHAIAYKLARQVGNYAPRTEFCEVIINNEYLGIYLLIEKITRDNNRVNISKLQPEDITGNELTGGYIIKIDNIAGVESDGWYSAYPAIGVTGIGLKYQYHYPKASDITIEQKQYIKNWISKFENTMASNQRYDQNLGYYNLVDMESIVDYFIINEICKNYDMSSRSFFMYKNKDSQDPYLHFGPVWDFDLAMGNAWDENVRSPEGWYSETFYHPWGLPLGRPFWSKLIWEDNNFKKQFKDRIISKRNGALSNANILSIIDNMVDDVSDAVDRNFSRWPILGVKIWPMDLYDHNLYLFNTYDMEINYLKEWFKERLNWIDTQVPPGKPTNLTAVSYQGGILLQWGGNAETDIDYYNIYRNSEQNFNIAGQSDTLGYVSKDKSTYHDENNLVAHKTYYYKISAVDNSGNESDYSDEVSITTLDVDDIKITDRFKLEQNYPNPFNPSTIITYILSEETDVTVSIFDILGKEVVQLASSKQLTGSHSVQWNGTDNQGNPVCAGVYIYQLKSINYLETKKMLLLR